MRAISAVAELLLWTLRCSYEFVLLFDPPPVKIRGGEDLYTNCWSFTYDPTSEIHLMAIHCAAAERGGLIKKKESSWKKLIPTYRSGDLIIRFWSDIWFDCRYRSIGYSDVGWPGWLAIDRSWVPYRVVAQWHCSLTTVQGAHSSHTLCFSRRQAQQAVYFGASVKHGI